MKAQFKTAKTFDEAQKFTKAPRADELVDALPKAPKEWQTLRFVGPLVPIGGHWLNTEPPHPTKKTKAYYKACLAFNPQTEERDSTIKCPYCEDESGWIRPDLVFWQNAIVRSLEEDAPAKRGKLTDKEEETGFKEKGSKAWTPVRAVRITGGTVRELKKLSMLNRHTSKKTGEKKSFPLTHEKFGCDVELMYDPDASAGKQYSVQKGEKSKLTEEQGEYLMWDVENLVKPEKEKEAIAEYKRWLKTKAKAGGEDEKGDDSDEDEDRMKSKKAKAKSKSRDDEDEDDEDDNEFKGKKSKGSKKKSRDEDEDDEDDEDEDEDEDDEDEEDEKPAKSKKSKSKSKGKKSKKSRDDDDDDEDEDDDD